MIEMMIAELQQGATVQIWLIWAVVVLAGSLMVYKAIAGRY